MQSFNESYLKSIFSKTVINKNYALEIMLYYIFHIMVFVKFVIIKNNPYVLELVL